jgi:ABC-2 type transport system permease protein
MTTMTTPSAAAPTPSAATARPSGSAPVRLIKAELLKIWTTNAWWIFGILLVVYTALALWGNLVQANGEIGFAVQQANQPPPDFGQPFPPGEGGPTAEDIQRMRDEYERSTDIARVVAIAAANVYTSGQFFGLLFIVILGAMVVTNEFFHQTATATFLTTPHRTRVIIAKLAAAMMLAAGFWAVTTAMSLGVGSLFFGAEGHGLGLGEWPVIRSILMNLLAYVVWAVLGVGLGVLIRSQLGATLTGSALYLLSFPAAFAVFGLIRTFIVKQDWVWQWMVVVPGVASQTMISPVRQQLGPITGPPWWVGAVVLIGYGVVAGLIGTLITRKRDIS